MGREKRNGNAGAQQEALFGGEERRAASGSGGGPARLVLIDGHALAYRSYFALRQLSTSAGVPTNAVYGFARALLEELRSLGERDLIAVAFDTKAPTFRSEAWAEYKAHRPKAPSDLPQQLRLIKRLLDLLGVPRLEVAGMEADDLIATLAVGKARAGYAVEILTTDRDALQLVTKSVSVRTQPKGELIGPAEVFERHGVRPEQWVDFRALTGDASDNLPGVPGIGPVTARALLAEFGSLDALLAALSEPPESPSRARIPQRHREAIGENLAALHLSRDLSRLRTDVELGELDLTRAAVNRDELREFLVSLEFGSILRELGLKGAVEYGTGDFAELQRAAQLEPPLAAWAYGFTLDGERSTSATVTALAVVHGSRIGVAEGAHPGELLVGSVNAADAKALVVAARRSRGVGEARAPLPGDDPLLMAYLLDLPAADPAALARRLGAGEWSEDAEARAAASAELIGLLAPRLVGAQRRIYLEIERPLQAVLVEMELAGVKLDAAALQTLERDSNERLAELESRLRLLAGDAEFNVNSRDQVAWLLFEKLGLRGSRRTSTGKLSTAVSALAPLTGQHEAVDLILEHRELAKLVSTYLVPLRELMDDDGRIRTTLKQAVVATGRLSSVNPNLQAIPVRSPVGREVRRAVVAERGERLLVADYSQIELRILAHLTGEPALKAAFLEGEDVHAATAASLFEAEPATITPEMRAVGKTINFGVLYGMGPERLARDLNVSFARAEAFIAAYFARYPRVRAYIEETISRGRELGYVETLLGRRRGALELRSPERGVREAAERMAFNMPVQGTAADMMKLAMLRLAPALEALSGRLLLQVHDEIIAEVPKGAAAEAAGAVEEIMSNVYPLDVPLVVRVGVGVNWLEAS